MSEDFIKGLYLNLNKKESLYEKGLKILRFQFFRKSNLLKVILRALETLNEDEEDYFKNTVKKTLGVDVNVEILCYKDVRDTSVEEIANRYWMEVIGEVLRKNPLAKDILCSENKKVEENKIIINYGCQALINHIRNKHIEEEISSHIDDIFNRKVKVEFRYDESLTEDNYEEKKLQENKQIIKDVLEGRIESHNQEKPSKEQKEKPKYEKNKYEKPNFKREPKGENTILGRNISNQSIPIKDINETSGYVAVTGEIFKVETLETKTGKIILSFFITDLTSSIMGKCFLKPGTEQMEILDQVKKGLYCKIRGEAIFDTFAKEVVIMVRDIVKMKKKERMDGAEKKRVELHMHTTMSAMDGVTPAKKLIERAAKWGHTAVAITDHGVVQAFPEAQMAEKDSGLKVIYGVEGYLVNNGIPVVLNENGKNTLDDTYVVFDLETTGFSSKNDKIIEIGAVKIKEGSIVDRFSEFVNPEMRIPYNITELTSITDEMVENAETIEKILPKFLEFCKDSVIVAHNAGFDVGFIKKMQEILEKNLIILF